MKLAKMAGMVSVLVLLVFALPAAGILAAPPRPPLTKPTVPRVRPSALPVKPQAVPDDAFWSSQFQASGVTDDNGNVSTVWVIRQDASGNLYVGGDFVWAGGVRANGIARWDGYNWSALGSGLEDFAIVYDILIDGGNVYVAGDFTTASGVTVHNVARWNGSTWSALGAGADVGTGAAAYSLARDQAGNLYVGGLFDTAGYMSVPADRIAMWNGSSWSALGSGITGGTTSVVNSLAWDGTYVYACGIFDTAGGTANRNNIARWNPAASAWSDLGTGLTDPSYARCDAVAAGTGGVYAGGSFTSAGGAPGFNNIARWNGSAWSPLGTGADNAVTALGVLGSNLYAGGAFTQVGGVSVTGTAIWNGGNWSGEAPSTPGDLQGVAAILPLDATRLDVGGYFWSVGGAPANGIAAWDGAAWHGLGPDNTLRLDGDPFYSPSSVAAVAADAGGRAYAGGNFAIAGGTPASNVAVWASGHWSALGGGLSGPVAALAAYGNILYAGGSFSEAGGQPALYVARWDGANWSALGGGPTDAVSAFAVDGAGNVYAGGAHNAGGPIMGWVAMWNGSAWTALGTAPNGPIAALAVDGSGNLYAGGDFLQIGGVPANDVAKWNGSTWTALGSGTGSLAGRRVQALAARGSDVYAGGLFDTAGGNAAANIARWDGASWLALGSGLTGQVNALAFDGAGALYAGGSFDVLGGSPGNHIARWVQGSGSNGTWSALGSGATGNVDGLATFGPFLFAGGDFAQAGAKPSIRFGSWSTLVLNLKTFLPLVVR
jgi:hypothetical protein